MSFKSLFCSMLTVWRFIFITKNINGNIVFFVYLSIVYLMNRKFYAFKIKFSCKFFMKISNLQGFCLQDLGIELRNSSSIFVSLNSIFMTQTMGQKISYS